MSLETPSVKEVNDDLVAQIQVQLNQTVPLLPKAFIRVLAKALAGVFIVLYKYCGFIFLQMFIETASNDETVINGVVVRPLTEHGRREGVGDPTPATNAQLSTVVTVENQTGTLAAGSLLNSSTNGFTYIVLSATPLNSATVTVTIKAVNDPANGSGAGSLGNLSIGDIVSFINPLPNVARDTTVSATVVTASDAETTEDYRARILDRTQKRPQGGAYADYEQWGEEVAGIINVYPYTGLPGQVSVYCEATVASSGSADGIPTAPQLQAVADSINLANRKPVGVFLNTYGITRQSFKVTVTGLTAPNLSTTQINVTSALRNLFVAYAPFIDGLTLLPANNVVTQNTVSATITEVVNAAGGSFTSAIFELSATPGALTTYTLGEGEKAKAETVVYA